MEQMEALSEKVSSETPEKIMSELSEKLKTETPESSETIETTKTKDPPQKLQLDEESGGIFSKLWPFSLMELVLGAKITQVIGILNYFAHFAVYPFVGTLLFLYMIFSSYWYIAAIYLAWYVYDAKTPQNGGRSFTIGKNWKTWKAMRDFFPISLHKDAELDPTKNYIFGYHPHGMTVYGAFVNFGVACTGFEKMFPGLRSRLLTIEAYYKFPVYRDYLMLSGLVSVHRDSYRAVLSNEGGGVAAVVVPGGAEEALECTPDKMTIILNARRGFIKMAIRTGAQLVPVLSFGENETYRQVDNPRGSLLRKIQTNMMHLISFSTPVFYGQHGTIIPFRVPINTVVGAPIAVQQKDEPEWAEVLELHGKYKAQLQEMFEKYKIKFGYSEDYKLEIL